MKSSPAELNTVDLRLFEAMPGNSLLLLPDQPRFTIIAVTEDYYHTAGKSKQELIGKGLFEAFPNSPGDPELTGEKTLRASLEYAFTHKETHHLPVHRYDVGKADGSFEERYWTAVNKPVLDESGEVMYIIHATDDVTRQVKAEQTLEINKGMEKAYNLFMNAPVIIGILKGDDYRIELANEGLLEVWGRSADVIGQPLLKAIPELEEQGFIALLDRVRTTGESFYAYEFPITLNRGGKDEVLYFDFVYKAVYDNGTEAKASGIVSVGHDVTAQVLARRSVQESEARYRNLFESMNQGFCVVEMIFDADNQPVDYRFLEINPVFEKQTGLKDAIGKTALELVPNLEAHWLELYGNVALTGQPVHFVEGSAAMGRWFEVNAFPTGDENSRRVALLFTDISERKKNEEVLKQSEAILQKRVAERTAELEEQKRLIGSILEASLDGIYALKAIRDTEGRITDFQYLFANHNTARLLKRNVGEVIGSSMLELLPENRNNGFFDAFCNILDTGKVLRGETHFITNHIDGWYDYVIVPIDRETIVVTTKDITEKKQASNQMEEQRNLLDNILKSSSNGISVSQVFRDESGKVVDALTIMANDAAVKYIGLPKDIYLSKRATEIEPEVIGSPYYQSCIKTLETGEPFVMQYQMHATGRWLELTVSRLDYNHLIQIFTDVTPIKEAQLQLEKSIEDLKRSNQNLEEFAYAASHDLKEPMRKIQ
ncbi:MAG TPA: PAS domain-containing protein, partial [Chitinophagaceae bacterium]|nr:PAS domain-containing protein [Chitinophagaceae bacterium]